VGDLLKIYLKRKRQNLKKKKQHFKENKTEIMQHAIKMQ